MFHLVEIVVTKNLWSQNADILDFITVAISEADEIQSDILIQHVKYLYYLLCRKYAYYCFIIGSHCSLLGCRHSFVNMAVYLHTGQWSVNLVSQVVQPLTFGEISTTYKSGWYDHGHRPHSRQVGVSDLTVL